MTQEKKKKSKSKTSKSAAAKAGEVSAASDATPRASDTAPALNGNELRKRDMTPRVEEVEED